MITDVIMKKKRKIEATTSTTIKKVKFIDIFRDILCKIWKDEKNK